MGRRYSTLDSSVNGYMGGQLLGCAFRMLATWPGGAAIILCNSCITGYIFFGIFQLKTWTSPNMLFLKNERISIETRCAGDLPFKGNGSEWKARNYLCLPSYRYKAMANKFLIENMDDWGNDDKRKIDSNVQAFVDLRAEEKRIKKFERENPNHPAILASNKNVKELPVFDDHGGFEPAPNTPYNFECEVRNLIHRDNHCGPYLESTPTHHLKTHK
jgi:hypothetical protein